MSRSMMLHSNVKESLWAEAINTAVYVRNRSTTKILGDKTPYEMWHSKKPNVKHFRVFGSPAVALDKTQNKKFAPKGKSYIFVGYSATSKAYRLYDMVSKNVVEKRDVKFCENMPGNTDSYNFSELIAEKENNNSENEESDKEAFKEEISPKIELQNESGKEETSSCNSDEVNEEILTCAPTRGRGRPRIIRSGVAGRPRKVYQNLCFLRSENIQIPLTVTEAYKSEFCNFWKDAMAREYQALQENDTWTVVDLPHDKKVIGCKWVFNLKNDEHGNVQRFKARLVAKGCSQEFGINFNETFSPVVRYSTIRIMLALAAEHSLYLHHVDVSTAYLNSKLEEEVYMRPPDGFVDKIKSNKVLKLQRTIYGLKQSGRAWNVTLDRAIREIGFVPCKQEPCLYQANDGNKFNLIAVYVDDIMIGCSDKKDLEVIKRKIAEKFKIVDGGEVKHFLGMEIERETETGSIAVDHRQYIENLLRQFEMEKCKPVSTPLDPGFQIHCSNFDCKRVEPKEYQSLIGALMYLAISTRPDILHSVGKLAQKNNEPHFEHLTAAKHILRYLSATSNLKLVYIKTGEPPKAYVDADWANCHEDRKSYTGMVFVMAGSSISWESKKQPNIALSSTEAEFVALSTAAREAVYLKRLLSEINCYDTSKPMLVYGDNLGAQCMAKNPVLHGRSKHIDVKYLHVRDVVKANEIELRYTPTDENVSDVLTKNLTKAKHLKFVRGLGLQ